MFPGPVFYHELRTVARRKRFYALRLVFGLFLVYLVFTYTELRWFGNVRAGYEAAYDHEYTHNELARIGAGLFGSVLWLQAFAVGLLTPGLVAGAIGEDRERKILSYLLASPLTAAEIVLGKLAARLVNLAILILVALPVVSITLFLGGVDPNDLWLAFAATMSTLYFIAAVSIFISTFTNRPRDAIIAAYLFEVAWLFFPAIERGLAGFGVLGPWIVAARPVTDYLTWSSPSYLLVGWAGGGAGLIHIVSWLIGLQVLYGTLLIAWSTLRLRAVEQGSRLFRVPIPGLGPARDDRRLRARRPCGDDPMLWKECANALSTGSRWKAAGSIVLTVGFLAGLAYWFYEAGLPAAIEMNQYGYGFTTPASDRQSLNVGVRIFTACLYPLMALLIAVHAASGFTSERERDTWISLVSTPLEGREVVRGKVLGALWRVRWVALAMALVWLIGLLCGAVHPLGLIAALTSTLVYASSFAALGTDISLRSKTSARAIATTLGIAFFFSGGYLFCCIPAMNGPDSILVFAGLSPFIVVGSLFTFTELDWLFSHNRARPDLVELMVMWTVSMGFYSLGGLKLIHDCLERFQVEVDRPHRGHWPRPESDSRGIRFIPEDSPDLDGISFEESSGEPRPDDGEGRHDA